MKSDIFKYLKNYSQQPKEVDRLIFSAFAAKAKLRVQKNRFLRSYIIKEENSKEFEKLNEFLDLLNKSISDFNFETLVEFFEFVISPADRIITGAIYTPKFIRDFIAEESFSSLKNKKDLKIADISCGCAGFLLTAAKLIRASTGKSYHQIFKENIYGLDIQSYSITRAKILLAALAISDGEDAPDFTFNLFCGDALNFKWNKKLTDFSGFDVIIGNPPYVCSRNISDQTKILLQNWTVCSSGHPDLYIPFFQIGLELLMPDGILGFITMNSFFKSLNGRSLRDYFQQNQYSFKIIDFGTNQVFKSRNTYTCICLIRKKKLDHIKYLKLDDPMLLTKDRKSFQMIKYAGLDFHKGWNLQNNEIISKIESTGTAFGEKFKTRNGIATLKNHLYIFNPIDEDSDYYYLQNGSIYKIEKGICKDIVNPNKLANGNDLKSSREKVIFPYDFGSLKPTLYSERHLRKEFPQTFKYLEAKKNILAERDKGNGEYENWFAFGRNQSLEKMKHKLFLPHITCRIPTYLINSDEDLLFYNGIAVLGESKRELQLLKKIMESRLFWFYIINSSKPYTSGYYSLSRNYIKGFGIYHFSIAEVDYILEEEDEKKFNSFIEAKYGVSLDKLC